MSTIFRRRRPAARLAIAALGLGLLTTGAHAAWSKVANEWQGFSISAATDVRFGVGSNWVVKTVKGAAKCDRFHFGRDPAVGRAKTCEKLVAGTATAPAASSGGSPRLSGVPGSAIAVAANVGQTVIRTVTLGNTGGSNLEIDVFGSDLGSGVSSRYATIAPSKSLALRLALACDKAGSRTVRHRIESNDPARAAVNLDVALRCSEPSVTWSGPITITRGGTYRGNWSSSSTSVPAVSIRTREPVVIENCRLRGPGNLIASRFSASDGYAQVNVTIRNCYGQGTGPITAGEGRGHFFIGVWPRRVVLENNYYANTTGVWVLGNESAKYMSALRITGNRVRNVVGRRNAIAISGVREAPGVDVGWNEIINEPFKSWQEDNILTYHLMATQADPARIHDNFIDGAYPRNPRSDSSSGSGINAGDAGGRTGGNHWVRADNNHIVRPVNVGAFIAAGQNNLLSGNRVLRSGLLPDGTRIAHMGTGLYVYDCCYGQVASGYFRHNIARNNHAGYESVNSSGKVARHANRFDHCARDSAGRSLCTGNTSPSGRVTTAMENAERQRWLDRVAARGTPIGPR